MEIKQLAEKFDMGLNALIQEAAQSGLPLDFMANRFAAAEFELRTATLAVQRANAEKAMNGVTTGKILHMGDIKLSLPTRNGAH